mmetsp:Transcript_76994/g.214040  ORF Transcript_76994/g.214040 Transcript_76994/m.214040 type:complete len:276 (-) Transcript_76994:581-1408(-)
MPSLTTCPGRSASASEAAPSQAACRTHTARSLKAFTKGTAQPTGASRAPQRVKLTMWTAAARSIASVDCDAACAASYTSGTTRVGSVRAALRRQSRAASTGALTSSRSSTLGAASLVEQQTTGTTEAVTLSLSSSGQWRMSVRSSCRACTWHCSDQRGPVGPVSLRTVQASSTEAEAKASAFNASVRRPSARRAAASSRAVATPGLVPTGTTDAFPESAAAATSSVASAAPFQCCGSWSQAHHDETTVPTTPRAATWTSTSASRTRAASAGPSSR